MSDTPPRKEYEVFSYYRYNKFYYISLSVVIVAFFIQDSSKAKINVLCHLLHRFHPFLPEFVPLKVLEEVLFSFSIENSRISTPSLV